MTKLVSFEALFGRVVRSSGSPHQVEPWSLVSKNLFRHQRKWTSLLAPGALPHAPFCTFTFTASLTRSDVYFLPKVVAKLCHFAVTRFYYPLTIQLFYNINTIFSSLHKDHQQKNNFNSGIRYFSVTQCIQNKSLSQRFTWSTSTWVLQNKLVSVIVSLISFPTFTFI